MFSLSLLARTRTTRQEELEQSSNKRRGASKNKSSLLDIDFDVSIRGTLNDLNLNPFYSS